MGDIPMKTFLKVVLFILFWLLAGWFVNGFLLRQPFIGGKFAHRAEALHWWVFGGIGAWCAFKDKKGWFIFMIGWCFVDEFIQIFMPNRIASWMDVLRNVIGLLSGYLIVDVGKQVIQRLKEGR